MSDNRYDDRVLKLANVFSVSWTPGDGKSPLDQGTIRFNLSGLGDNSYGPLADVELAILHDPKRTLAEAEIALLRAAHEVIQRLAAFEFEEVHTAYLESKKSEIFAKGE